MTKRLLLLLLACIAIGWQAHAQFQYSVKAGCSWPNISKMGIELKKENPSFTFGANVDYTMKHFGLQTGLTYRQISEDGIVLTPGGAIPEGSSKASYLEVPLLATLRIAQTPKICNLIIGAGPYAAINIGKSVDGGWEKYVKYRSYYGIMATAQLEFFAHYFIRGEYQWALHSDRKDYDDRRTNIFSLVAGYKF